MSITLKVTGNGLGRIQDRLERSAVRLRAAGQQVAQTIVVGNQRDRLAGVDRFGRRLPPRKEPRRDGASGPVLAPHSTGSRAITTFDAKVTLSNVGWRVTAGWSGAPWLAYHAAGAVRGAPVRDILGITPQTQRDAFNVIREAALGV